MVRKYGYPVETHKMQTPDGYTLKVFRIPYGQNSQQRRINKKPILLMHGLFSSAEHFILTGKYNSSLAYLLADNGYDVWLGNARGNYPSRKHRSYDFRGPKFWDYCWHEMGKYDLPTMIDYILNKTKQKKISYIGHSQGCIILTILLSINPAYNEKINFAGFLAPAHFWKHSSSSLVSFSETNFGLIKNTLKNSFWYTLPPLDNHGYSPLEYICRPENDLFGFCEILYKQFVSTSDFSQYKKDVLPLIVKNIQPASIKQLEHFVQCKTTGRFAYFDYGIQKNLRIYGSATSPDYNINNTKVPVAIFYGFSDPIISYEDVRHLSTLLPKCVSCRMIENAEWNHVDFTFAINAWNSFHHDLLDRKSVV